MVKIRKILKEFKEGIKLFGETIAIIFNSILLTIVYFLGVGLTSIVAKIFGKKFINKNLNSETYWEELDITTTKFEDYYRQF